MSDTTPDSGRHPADDASSGSSADGHGYLDSLINAHFDGLFTDESLAEFEAAMQESAAARRRFWELAVVHAASRDASRLVWGDVARIPAADCAAAATAGPDGGSRGFGLAGLGRFAAGVVAWLAVPVMMVALLGGLGWHFGRWPALVAALGIPDSAVAEISRVRYASEAGTNAALTVGRWIGRQRLAIGSGVVEIAVRNGAAIVVEGPAELEVASETLAFLSHGTAVVRLPPGLRGFVLETPTVTIDARGGEFGVRIDSTLKTDVQAYSGDVVATGVATTGSGCFPRAIAPCTALRFGSAGESEPAAVAFDEGRFIRRLSPEPGRGMQVERHDKPTDALFGTPTIAAIDVTRAPGPVVVDGRLDEWNPEAFFRRRRQEEPADEDWIEGRMMYDDRNLYIAARVGDPAPMRNCVNPDLDPLLIWHGGGLQLFLSVDRGMGWPAEGDHPNYLRDRRLAARLADVQKAENPKLMSLLMWHHAPSGKNRLSITRRITGDETVVDPEGAKGMFVQAADGKGYTLEYAIPWKVLGAGDDPPRRGDTLAAAWELHLSDETGRVWRNQIIDIRNPAEPRGIFLYERASTWGRAEYR